MEIYKIKKGLDLRLEGVAARKTEDVLTSDEFALVPDDFPGIVPKVKVREGDRCWLEPRFLSIRLQKR